MYWESKTLPVQIMTSAVLVSRLKMKSCLSAQPSNLGVANGSLQAEYSQHLFVNEVVLGHSHAHLLIYYLWLRFPHTSRVGELGQTSQPTKPSTLVDGEGPVAALTSLSSSPFVLPVSCSCLCIKAFFQMQTSLVILCIKDKWD